MKIQAVRPKITFRNRNYNDEFLRKLRSRYVYDAKTRAYVLKEFFEHSDLADKGSKADKVIEDLMYKTTQIVSVGCLEAIDTLRAIKHKHPHLEKLADECIDLLEYYNACKIW